MVADCPRGSSQQLSDFYRCITARGGSDLEVSPSEVVFFVNIAVGVRASRKELVELARVLSCQVNARHFDILLKVSNYQLAHESR